MKEAIEMGESIFGKLFSGNFGAFTVSDIIWLIGAVVLMVLAVKVAAKFFKVILVILALLVLVVFLFSSGII